MKLKTKISLGLFIVLAVPFLMGQQGCESPLIPIPDIQSSQEETKNIRGTKVSFSYDNDDLIRIAITHFHQGVIGEASVFLTNEKGAVLHVLYQNLVPLFDRVPNRGIVKRGIAQKGDLVGIEIQFKCLNPFGCKKPADFSGFYILASGQEVIEQ